MTSIKFRALTHDDHKLFFEALGEYGKDFQNIQQYMTQKCTTKSEKKEDDKKREQIRNFYNKLYAKLSQLIGKLDDGVEKVNQELYLLINYGEIWKKHGFKFNNKTKKLLEELVHQGYTTLRFKNKNVRLRTPACKALKKINQIGIDEKTNVVTTRELPKDVVVEFHPATNRDWLRVQSISQNPRVRARLSMQKRVSTILEYLENKWNISQDKLNRAVDTWLKISPNNPPSDDVQPTQQHYPPQASNLGQINLNQQNCNKDLTVCVVESGQPAPLINSGNGVEAHSRLRLRPSSQHELKEVNITRVVPDYHLDLSFNAYVKRLGVSGLKLEDQVRKNANTSDEPLHTSANLELSQGTMSNNSRLPVSLTTPDSSVLLERSVTSDQPSIAQARKHLNLLQTLAGTFEGCENSRTAEDTQDRSLHGLPQLYSGRSVNFQGVADQGVSQTSLAVNNDIPALFDEDAAIDTMISSRGTRDICPEPSSLNNSNQVEKSVDFHIPKNLTLDDWFKMAGNGGGDDANDAFPSKQTNESSDNINDNTDNHKDDANPDDKRLKNPDPITSATQKANNHVIEIEKLAEGWIRHEDSPSISIGELYLAFKCPEKIVLEYEFENFTHDTQNPNIDRSREVHLEYNNSETKHTSNSNIVAAKNPEDSPFSDLLIFKLLTAASLSLAQIERQKLEQQHKLHDQPGAKLKRRKGPCNPNTIKFLKREDCNLSKTSSASGQGDVDGTNNNALGNRTDNNNYTNNDKNQPQAMTLRDIETTNQRVEEALKQLQPTRLSVFRRAR